MSCPQCAQLEKIIAKYKHNLSVAIDTIERVKDRNKGLRQNLKKAKNFYHQDFDDISRGGPCPEN